MLCVEAKVDGLSSTVDTPTVTSCGLSEAVGNLTRVMDEVVSVFKKALYFVILKVSSYHICAYLILYTCVYLILYVHT